MTEKEFYAINWHRGNVAKLENGKEYLVKGTSSHGKYLILYSEEYDSKFVADHRIVVGRTSDYEEPIEVYLEHKRMKREAAEAKREAERQEYLRLKAEKKQKNIEAQERAHQEAVARKEAAKKRSAQSDALLAENNQKDNVMAKPVKSKVDKPKPESTPVAQKVEEPVAEAPKKRVRQRIRISQPVAEKVSFYKKK